MAFRRCKSRLYENHTHFCLIIIQSFSTFTFESRKEQMANYGTLLAVDDNAAVLTAIKICLEDVFERIITLSSPETILTRLNQEPVDAILLDMNFCLGVNSGQDGLLWLRSIHKLHPDIPVVLITAYADVQLAVRGLKSGAVDFITKPWDNDVLIRTLKDAIDRNREIVPLHQVESNHVQKAVEKCHGNISKAAELLGITRQTLYAKIKKK